MKKIFLIDAYALIYRAYFGFIRNPVINSKGQNTSAMLGVVNILNGLLEKEKPDYIAVAFDMNVPTFRHNRYEEYKANRETMPEDLQASIPYVRRIFEAYNIPIVEKAGFEADDIIATLAKRAEKEGFISYMVTPDKDYAQLVNENSFVYKPKPKNEVELWDIDAVKKKFGIEEPLQVIDILGLMGDASDNIPGCPGVGPKTAEKLIGKYGSIENIYAHIDELKGKQKETLIANKEQVLLSKELVTIITDVPLEQKVTDFGYQSFDKEKVKELFQELEFRTLARRLLGEEQPIANTQPQAQSSEAATSLNLFGEDAAPDKKSDNEPATLQMKSLKDVPHDYQCIDTAEKVAKLIKELSQSSQICWDTETTAVNPLEADLVGISLCVEPQTAYYIPVYGNPEKDKVLSSVASLLENPAIGNIGQNLKYDILVMQNQNITVKGELFDTMIAHYLLEPSLRHNMDYMANNYLQYQPISITTLIGAKGKKQGNMKDVSADKVTDYACEDVSVTLQLWEVFEPQLREEGLYKIFEEIEMPLVPVLADMERTGVCLDTAFLNNYAEELNTELNNTEAEIKKLAGEEFNVSSAQQLGGILFDKLKISDKPKLTKTKQYATDEETLTKLTNVHPIVEKVLRFRTLKKLLSTYIIALPELVNPTTNKIHTSFNQAVANTGRLSSTNPNLQNIPIRTEEGRKVRKAFVPSEGNVLIAADYSQVELRLMAEMSDDKHMVEAFANNEDIHTATAAKIYDIAPDAVDSDMRRHAKTANFGIIYGISAFGLSQRLDIPRKQAKALIEGYFAAFPGVKSYMERSVEEAKQKGYTRTLFGRKRKLPDINSSNATIRGYAERNAINSPIQGTAADIIKVAMIRLHKALTQKNIQSRIIIQVHDELVLDVPKNEVEQVLKMIETEMTHIPEISKVPLPVEAQQGDNWHEAH